MKSIIFSLFITLALTFHAQAYLDVEEGAYNVRHFHMIKRSENGEIVGRAFGASYDIGDLEARGKCTTVSACGTPAGCALMAPQRYCKGEDWQKGFQRAVKQTGANGMATLKTMAEGIGRGPVGMVTGLAKSAAKGIIKSKQEKKSKNKKRSFEDDGEILSRSVYEFVERDEDMNFVRRGEFVY